MLLRSRTPRGVRGLKSLCGRVSRYARSRTPRGVRGLKHKIMDRFNAGDTGRTPRGVRGLKPDIG